jgi:hypothetical protein
MPSMLLTPRMVHELSLISTVVPFTGTSGSSRQTTLIVSSNHSRMAPFSSTLRLASEMGPICDSNTSMTPK